MKNTSCLLLNFETNMEQQQQNLSPVARLFHSQKFSCYIVIRMGCSTRFNPEVIKFGLEQTLLKHPRFSSKMVNTTQHKFFSLSLFKVPFCSLLARFAFSTWTKFMHFTFTVQTSRIYNLRSIVFSAKQPC